MLNRLIDLILILIGWRVAAGNQAKDDNQARRTWDAVAVPVDTGERDDGLRKAAAKRVRRS